MTASTCRQEFVLRSMKLNGVTCWRVACTEPLNPSSRIITQGKEIMKKEFRLPHTALFHGHNTLFTVWILAQLQYNCVNGHFKFGDSAGHVSEKEGSIYHQSPLKKTVTGNREQKTE